jgi:hypothetical protein
MDIVERLEGYLRWNNKDEIAHEAKHEIERLREALSEAYDYLRDDEIFAAQSTLRSALQQKDTE